MSANILVVGGSDPRTVRRTRLVAVPDVSVDDVRDIASAPSARRRRDAQRQELPAMRREPANPKVESQYMSIPLGRVLLGGLAVLALSVGGVGVGSLLQPSAYEGPTRVHSVMAGESVWSLAQAVETDRPLEAVVADIESLNNVRGGLGVGDRIIVPVD
ncbi:LysM peptidoglycan-binding domain-containing protein [Schaalia vaccimaxillae]|uniref:LysM peptidoglycan-binding domain-containing protein n=1 Tax=Schaalia vaccimaxillae TaxID=183916 RepID=UPI0003B7A52B|nr:LysM peptidoglycan-binding domain-containing protein [Schaalia vaccimaxillae]